ncbi:MAG TPA: M43 family zinc metalloprotease [Arachidicoccus soli]|nr:M43 family zinc metalloprotease [Arachidicoccus soli]
MKRLLLSIITIGLFTTAFSQENQPVEPCATSQKMQEFVQSLSPHDRALYKLQRQTYEQHIQQYIQAHKAQILSNDHEKTIKYVIPVVFHIIHEGGPENISYAQVVDAVKCMNEDYQALNSDLSNTIPYFQSRIANIQVEFKLAKLDPNGNCTNGVTRTFSTSSSSGDTQKQVQAVKNAHGNWPGDEYLNIFVASNIGGAAGFTMYPNDWLGSSMSNGIHVLDNYTGSIGTSANFARHTISHEAGHWLNLSHTWGDSNDPGLAGNCAEDDHVTDTPDTKGWKTCSLHGKTCASQDTAQYDNVQNIMEYSYCSTMFTIGQKARMWGALESSTGGRNNIWSAANLAATGVNLPNVLCKADFTTQYKVVCQGQPVQFKDLSYANVNGWDWNLQGATPSSSTAQNPTVVYNSAGIYPVELTATDGSSTVSTTKTAYIKVLPSSSTEPFVEGFEGFSNMSSSTWGVDNPGNNAAFEITNSAAYMGSKSAVLNNFGQPAGGEDALLSPPVDLSSVTAAEGATLTFRYAYRKRSTSNKEDLQVMFTNDCGHTWQTRYIVTSSAFGNATASSSWAPSSQSDWVTVNVTNITSEFWVSDFRVKFDFQSDGGNNLYLDNINIYKGDASHLAVIENEAIKGLSIYPNPATNTANISFNIPKDANANVQLVNMMGQTVLTNTVKAKAGKNLIVLGTHNVDAGVYLVKINVGGVQDVKRLVIK